jgi:hypothetical protein
MATTRRRVSDPPLPSPSSSTGHHSELEGSPHADDGGSDPLITTHRKAHVMRAATPPPSEPLMSPHRRASLAAIAMNALSIQAAINDVSAGYQFGNETTRGRAAGVGYAAGTDAKEMLHGNESALMGSVDYLQRLPRVRLALQKLREQHITELGAPVELKFSRKIVLGGKRNASPSHSDVAARNPEMTNASMRRTIRKRMQLSQAKTAYDLLSNAISANCPSVIRLFFSPPLPSPSIGPATTERRSSAVAPGSEGAHGPPAPPHPYTGVESEWLRLLELSTATRVLDSTAVSGSQTSRLPDMASWLDEPAVAKASTTTTNLYSVRIAVLPESALSPRLTSSPSTKFPFSARKSPATVAK